jgi:hypothetical protein
MPVMDSATASSPLPDPGQAARAATPATGPAATAVSAAPAASPALWPVCLAGALALAVAMGIGRFAFTPLLPLMQREGAIGDAQGAALAALNYAGYLLGALTAAVMLVGGLVVNLSLAEDIRADEPGAYQVR